jgi:hypothetical protein
MTYRLMTFYCARCRTATPHEYDTERERARCALCADKQFRLRATARKEALYDDTHRHIAALGGMGNQGEPPPSVATEIK